MGAVVTGVDTDLATLRERLSQGYNLESTEAALARVEAELSRLREVEESFKHLSSEYQFDMDRGDHLVYREEWERFDRWQRLRDTLEEVDFVGAEGFAADMVAAAQAEASRLREQRDYDVWNERILRRAAEARCARLESELRSAMGSNAALQQALAGSFGFWVARPEELLEVPQEHDRVKAILDVAERGQP
jgi:hypothetical protein